MAYKQTKLNNYITALFPATMSYYKHRQIATRQFVCTVVANAQGGWTAEIIEGVDLDPPPPEFVAAKSQPRPVRE